MRKLPVAVSIGLALTAPSFAAGVLTQRIDTWQGELRIADPSGITWLPDSDTFLVTDSEIDNTKEFQGYNLFEIGRDGRLVRAMSTLKYSREPTGIAFHPARGTLFITDDDQQNVFEVDRNGQLLNRIDTVALDSHDPEGIAVDPGTGNLWIVDGKGGRAHEVTVDGVALRVLDLDELEIDDPEGIAFDEETGHLFLVSNEDMAVFEVTTAGELVSSFGLSVLGEWNPKDLCLAPDRRKTARPGATSLFVADSRSPEYPDGKIDEVHIVHRPSGGSMRVITVGDEDGFGFRGSEPGFVHGDANRNGLLEVGEWVPNLDGLGGVDLGEAGDRFDHRDPSDGAPVMDVAIVVTEATPVRWTHVQSGKSGSIVWARLSIAVADARTMPGTRNEVWIEHTLLGEIVGHPDPRATDGAISLTVLEFPPELLPELHPDAVTVEIRRPAGTGADDIAIDFARLEIVLE